MDEKLLKELIRKIIISNEKKKFGVDELLIELKKEDNLKKYEDKDIRLMIIEAIESLSADELYFVRRFGLKSIKFNKKESVEISKEDKKHFFFVFLPVVILVIFSLMTIEIYFKNVFFLFSMSSFLVFLFVLFHNEYLDDEKRLSEKISLTIPIFGFIYYMLNDPFFSKYSYLPLDNHVLASNNLYSISISLFLSLFILFTFKNKLLLILAVVFIILFPFFQNILGIYLPLIGFLFYSFYKYNKMKEFKELADLFGKVLSLYKSKKISYIVTFSVILYFISILSFRTEDIKNSYYHYLSEPNNDFCINLNDDLNIIKSSSKSNTIIIINEELITPVYVYQLTQNEDINKVKQLDYDVIIQKEEYEKDEFTYNGILLKFQTDLEFLKKIKQKLSDWKSSADDTVVNDYISKNNNMVEYYLKYNNVDSKLSFNKCE